MLIKPSLLFFIVAGIFLTSAAKDSSLLCSGFLEPNSMSIPVSRTTGISKEQYDLILDRAENIFAEDFKNKGTKLTIYRNWPSAVVNAFASIEKDGTRTLVMHGGLARHKLMTTDAYAVTVCHELGHHLGGAPLRFYWLSTEGQADYYATLKCLRRFFAGDDNEKVLSTVRVDPFVKSECEKEFVILKEQLICIRSSMASLKSVEVSKASTHQSAKFSFTTPSKEVATVMGGTKHPSLQCRLDTYFNGARCAAPLEEQVSSENFMDGTCEYEKYHTTSKRPRCWFFPGF